MKRVIVASHAAFAKGMVSALELIAGNEHYVDVIEGFTVDENPVRRFDEILASYNENDMVIVLTDLTAGSVNKLIAERLRSKKFYLISGCNLAILLELVLTPENMIDESFINHIVKNGKNDITFMNYSLKKNRTAK